MIEYKNIILAKANLYKNISLEQVDYPVYVDGIGKKDCLCIGIGSLMQKTVSGNFKNIFTVYSADLYWVNNKRLSNPEKITMEKIIEDIVSVIDQLGLNMPVLLAHSAYGIVGIEAAKKLQGLLAGIIMVGSPPAWNNEVIAFARSYFEKYATIERKANDKLRKEKFNLTKKLGESDISVNAYEADSARYWGNYEIDRNFLEQLWSGCEADDGIMNHFFNAVLPANHLEDNIDKVNVPVFLAAGQYDYDCLPLELWKSAAKPKDFTMVDCGMVGHWPNLENNALFNAEIKKWVLSKL